MVTVLLEFVVVGVVAVVGGVGKAVALATSVVAMDHVAAAGLELQVVLVDVERPETQDLRRCVS